MIKPLKAELEYIYGNKNMAVAEIVAVLGCSKTTPFKWLRDYDIVPRKMRRPDRETLQDMYVDRGMSMKDIADELGFSASGIHKWLKEYNIPTRVKGHNGFAPITIDDVRAVFAENGHALTDETYVDSGSPLDFKCKCGRDGKMSLDSARRGRSCNGCKNERIGKTNSFTLDEVLNYFYQNKLTPLFSEYKNNQIPLEYICHCGVIAKTRLLNLRNGSGCWNCKKIKLGGENSVNWNPNLTKKDRERIRFHVPGYQEWRKQVFVKDNYTCRICSKSSGANLHAHHLESYANNRELRIDVSNGVTMCVDCHNDFHHEYGRGNNTKEQFYEFNEKGVDINGSSTS